MKGNSTILFPLLLCLVAPVLVGCPERENVARDYIGDWRNDDRDTDFITRIIISPYEEGQDLNVQDTFLRIQVYSHCEPEDCDWGLDTLWVWCGLAPEYEVATKYELEAYDVWVDAVLDRSTRVLTVLERHEPEGLPDFEIVYSFHKYG
jgi:hypothetical protein